MTSEYVLRVYNPKPKKNAKIGIRPLVDLVVCKTKEELKEVMKRFDDTKYILDWELRKVYTLEEHIAMQPVMPTPRPYDI